MKESTMATLKFLASTMNDIDYETTILIEEMSELAQVVCKLKRKLKFPQYKKYNKEKLYEEMAHVEISLAICKAMLEVDDSILDKVIDNRLSVMVEYRNEIAPRKPDVGE